MAYLACLESHGGLILCADTEGGHLGDFPGDVHGGFEGVSSRSSAGERAREGSSHSSGSGSSHSPSSSPGSSHSSSPESSTSSGTSSSPGPGPGSEGFVSSGPCLVSARALWLIESGRFELLRNHLDECEHYYALLAQHSGGYSQ